MIIWNSSLPIVSLIANFIILITIPINSFMLNYLIPVFGSEDLKGGNEISLGDATVRDL
jgi:hypothetical protein